MKNEIVKLEAPELKGLEKSRANQIKATFEPMAEMLSEFESKFNEIISESENEITKELTLKAKRVRLDIGKVRIETGKLKDKQKEYIKLEDRAIMGVHNILVWAVKEKEDKLKAIENYFEIQEQKRLEALQHERIELLSPYVEDAFERNLSGMEDDVWEAYLAAKKKEHEDRIEAEKEAERQRIKAERKRELENKRYRELSPFHDFIELKNIDLGEISEKEFNSLKTEGQEKKDEFLAEKERIRKENERLRKEAEAEAERQAKLEAERKAKEEAERKKREEEARIERERREKLEAELKAREEAERKAKEEEAAKIQAELNKNDSAKVKDLIADLKSLKTKYSFKSAKNKKMYADVNLLIDKAINHIEKY